NGLFPITKEPKVSTTPPASALDKIDLVVDTFNPKRNNVNSNNSEGNIENCNASCVFMETRMTSKASEILSKMSTLNNHPGSGMINMIIIRITPNNTDKSRSFIYNPLTDTY